MKTNALQQYAKLTHQLVEEKSQLEARLAELNQVLGTETTPDTTTTTTTTAEAAAPALIAQPTGRGRGRGQNAMSMRQVITKALTQRGPLTRKELGQAVLDLGYRSKAKNVLGSVGNLLYGKNAAFKSKDGKFYLAARTALTPTGEGNGEAAPIRRKRRKMSPEGKARIAAAQKARRARERAGK